MKSAPFPPGSRTTPFGIPTCRRKNGSGLTAAMRPFAIGIIPGIRSRPRSLDSPCRIGGRSGKTDPRAGNQAWLERRRAALAHWHKTGDPEPARELGLNLRDMSQVKNLLVDETTTVEELIKAHHRDIPISFPDNTAGFFCPACGLWMDAR